MKKPSTSFSSSRVLCLRFGMFLITTGICSCLSVRIITNGKFRINYGSLAHIKGQAVYIVPLVLQAVPAV